MRARTLRTPRPLKTPGSALALAVSLAACAPAEPEPPPEPAYVEPREPCAQRDPLRSLFFGDLHVHTRLSFDAYAMDVRVSQDQAYRFARGEEVRLPPVGLDGEGMQRLRIDRPLDFAALTDHSEFLGEIEACTVPGSAGYASSTCEAYRMGGNGATSQIGIRLTLPNPKRPSDVCPPDGSGCEALLGAVWRRVQESAAAAYDKTASCRFTSFVAYEYSAAPALSTMHRNVIFANDRVPAPTTYFEQPTPEGLWRELRATCKDSPTGCDVLAIPHNANESNGKMFFIESADEGGPADPAAYARLRAELEPLFEVYQHKGDSECMNGLVGIGAPDELCGFEKTLRPPAEITDCGDGTGSGGTTRKGCVSRRDFVRNALLDGLALEDRLGINPFRVGLIASTDTHNGTPGAVAEDAFIGHRGTDDDTAAKQLGRGNLTPGGVEFSPGGLTAVWAEENSRPALFAALKRREVYGTSGPRLAVRFFGGYGLPKNLCDDPQLVRKGYEGGVPMGGVLPKQPSPTATPSFVVQALRDPQGGKLQVAQIIKGTLRDGKPQTAIFDVAGRRDNGARVDEATCTASGPGADTLCGSFTDPDFRPGERSFYYVRVVENPSCRWTAHTCNRLPAAMRPPTCTDPTVPRTTNERAWTSPIWHQPD